MNFQAMNIQRKLILIAAGAGVISVFLPWLTVSVFGESNSINGFRGTGIVVFLGFIGSGLISLIGNQTEKLDKTMWLAVLVTGALSFIFTLISFGNLSSGGDMGLGLIEAGYGIGIWISLFASAGVLASAWLNKNPDDNVAMSIDSLKQNIASVTPAAETSKIAELEKLIEMKSQGKITEEEYQQLKSKII